MPYFCYQVHQFGGAIILYSSHVTNGFATVLVLPSLKVSDSLCLKLNFDVKLIFAMTLFSL